MARPVGVTLISVLEFLLAALCLLGGIGFLLGGGLIASYMNQAQGANAGAAGVLASLGAAVGVVFLVFAVLWILIAVGLLKVKGWARILTIILFGLHAILSVWGLVTRFSIMGLIFLIIDALIIWYMLKADVKAAFA